MHLYYNLTLRPAEPSNVYAIAGHFLGTHDSQEVAIARGQSVSLLRPGPSGKIKTLCTHDVSGDICSLERIVGSLKDLVVIGFCFGGLLVLEVANPEKPEFRVHNKHGFSKPINFLAGDPHGRAIMIAPRKEKKLILLSDWVEAPDSNTITYSLAALDCQHEHPLFAAIELDCSENKNPDDAQTQVSFYEVNLKENSVIRKPPVPVDSDANLLVTVPAAENGPGGILVCTKRKVIYKKLGYQDVEEVIPHIGNRGVLIVSAASSHHCQKSGLFFLLQTEFGDIFRVSLNLVDSFVSKVEIRHLDTIPVTYAMCILGTGFLFAAPKTGKHALYRLPVIEEGEASSSKKLVMVDDRESLLEMRVMNLFKGERAQVFNLCNHGLRSSFQMLRQGIKISKMSETTLPARPNGVWTMKVNLHERFIEYIAVSFKNKTQFFLENLKIDVMKPSLAVSLLGKHSMVLVHPEGIRHVAIEKKFTVDRRLRDVVAAGYNKFQLVVALKGRKLIYYAMCTVSGDDRLELMGRRRMPAEVACLCIPQVPEGMNRSFCLAVGLYDSTIQILVLHPTNQMWRVLRVLDVISPPGSLLFLSPQHYGDEPPYQFLNAGLQNGVLTTFVMTPSGFVAPYRSQFLGSRTPKLFSASARGQQIIICLSNRPWLGYMHNAKFLLSPFSCEALESAASICSCPQGVVAVTGDRLELYKINRLGESISKKTYHLDYTPTEFVLHPEKKLIVFIGSKRSSEEEEYGNRKKHKSCITILEPTSAETISRLELQENEMAVTLCTVKLDNIGTLLAVGIGIYESPATGFIRIYKILEEEKSLEVLRNTQVVGVPRAICQFGGALLVGMGPVLGMYDLGEEELHMRCKIKLFHDTCAIASIHVADDRIYVADGQEAIYCFKYREEENELYVFKYGNVPSSLMAYLHIDSETMAWADEYGNVFFVKFPQDTGDEYPTGSKTDQGTLLEIMRFNVGDVVTCLQKGTLLNGGEEIIIYGTVTGTIGALLPLALEDAHLISHLENQMRQEYPPLCHRSCRTYEYPDNCVIDGDICEQFQSLSPEAQSEIAVKLGSTESEILKKLGGTKSKII